MTNEEKKAVVAKLVNELAVDLKPEVERIEKSPMATKWHYGDYGSLLSVLSNGSKSQGQLIALALIKAGANEIGVTEALRLFV